MLAFLPQQMVNRRRQHNTECIIYSINANSDEGYTVSAWFEDIMKLDGVQVM